jgi:KipI family sensor histidine kinase inhibitor
MRILPVNRSTVLVELRDLDEVLALHASLTSQPLDGIEELLPAARTLMLRFDPDRLSTKALAEALVQRDLTVQQGASRAPRGSLVEIPMRYDGEDLAEVAQLAGLEVDDIIRRHQQSEFTVAFCGFAPGFAYLVGGDPALQVPRRSTPRPQVPAGSVALGGVYCGVYPQATPGGWRIIGATSLKMWDVDRDPPALLTPGMRVRFREVGVDVGVAAAIGPATSRQPVPETRRSSCHLEVTAALLPALLQDLGRPGHAHLGVAPSGAADRHALRAANRAVRNPPGLACLEITLGSTAFQCSGAMVVALAGAPTPISVQRASGEIFEAALGRPIELGTGDRVKLGYPARGLRTYLAVRGGFEVQGTLGSASRDTLAALGPAPIVRGDSLAVKTLSQGDADPLAKDGTADQEAIQSLPASGETVELDVTLGPRAEGFTDEAITDLCGQDWKVTPQSSRVGLRLQGARSLTRRDAAELQSEGLVRGAIQVPHDGQPVLLLADHPLTGGYPVIAVVAEHHLDLAGQIPPGAKIRFQT